MKRFFSMLMLLSIVFTAFAYDVKVGDLYYNLNNEKKQAYVCDAYSRCVEITIPETITYNEVEYSVTAVEEEAFRDCMDLFSVTFPKSLTRIGKSAFRNCPRLKQVFHLNPSPPIIADDVYDSTALTYCYVYQGRNDDYYVYYKNWLDLSNIRDYRLHITADDGFIYYITDYQDRTASVAYSNNRPFDVVIPTVITYDQEYYAVTEIDDRAFATNIIRSVTIPNSVTKIGKNAFASCLYLKSAVISSSVTHIGNYAFSNCESLTSIALPKNLTEIGFQLFDNCRKLQSVVIPSSVTTIRDNAFRNCASLTSIYIPNSVTTIGLQAFSKCTSLKSIEIPASVTSLELGLFNGCTSLTSVSLPSTLTSIGNVAFSYCTSLASITIPNSVKTIGGGAFADCTGLKSITNLADEPQEINDKTFENVDPNIPLYVHEEVKTDYYNTAGWMKFRENMTGINYDVIVDDLYYQLTNSFKIAYLVGCNPAVSDVIVPASIKVGGFEYEVTYIDREAFQQNYNLNSVVIGPNVLNIQPESFQLCSNLTSVTIPESVTMIAEQAFNGCRSLTSITIPKSVTQIGNYAFAGCTSLTRVVNYATTPQTIDWNTFDDVTGKTLVIYEESQYDYEHAPYWSAFLGHIETISTKKVLLDGICYKLDPDTRTADVVSGGDYSGHIDIPATITSDGVEYRVTSIGGSAFYRTGLTSITIPNSVTKIGYGAFSNCSALTEIEFPSSVTHIDQAFFKCNNLTKVVIPGSVTDIVESAFWNCAKLNTIVNLSPTPQDFGHEIFEGLDKNQATLYVPWASVSYYQSDSYWGEFGVILPIVTDVYVDGIHYILHPSSRTASVTWSAEQYAGAVSIPPTITVEGVTYTVTTIQYEAFRNCRELTSVEIPNTVTSIGDNAFELCTFLTAISLPASLTSIGNQAFMDCGRLTSITSYATEAPVLGFSVFLGVNNSIPVYVPNDSYYSYYMADGWDWFYNLQPFGVVQLADFNGDGRLSVNDLTLLISYYQSHQGSKDIDPRYDLSGDGQVSATDINTMVKTILKK